MINGFKGEYEFLSNFFRYPIVWKNMILPSAEHAYQSEKTTDENERFAIYTAFLPADAKRLGSPRKLKHLKPRWDALKDDVMLNVLRAKFSDPDLKKALLETGDHRLIEANWWGDIYWGVSNGFGKNRLGELLMKVRDELKKGIDNGLMERYAEYSRRDH